MSSVWITIGRDSDISINADGELVVQRAFVGKVLERVSLGKATKKRIEELQSYLEQLKCHCT
ncbi:hypothetical protein [Roseococcus sp.]|uniref:hypothetical protein n=1 Tax=Roseococcus sp. TaxID=2109646 RepID=UPI003BAB4A3A